MPYTGPDNYDPGEMDMVVTLLSPVETRDAAGGVVTTWANAGTCWADVDATFGKELQQASQKLGLAATTIRVRFRAINAKWRVLVGSLIYELIAPPKLIGRNMYFDLLCQAIDPTNLSINGIGIQAFVVALAQGDNTKAITYSAAFNSAPSAVYAVVVAPNGGYVIDCVVRAGSSLASGLIVDLGADVPASGYSLSIIAVQ